MDSTAEITWTADAEDRLQRAPVFLRGMVRRLAEKKAREQGITTITGEHLAQWKSQTMGAMGGAEGMQQAAAEMAEGRLPWTQAARERLATVPEFMRAMVRQIAEEIAAERGHLEVNVELLRKVEALGELEEEPQAELPWTDLATVMLQKKIEGAPEIAKEFVFKMLKRDAEDLARAKGYTAITAETLRALWEAPQEEVRWTEEAWRRLHTSPDFVRSGIKKAAERRARKMGAAEITSELLTRFRNEAMMKAVMRIRKLGFTELTFDAFDAAKGQVKRLVGNEQAEKRLEEIRAYMKEKPPGLKTGGVLGEALMQRFRKYLKGEGSLKGEE